MATVNSIKRGAWAEHRKVTGAPVAADSSDPAALPRSGLLNCYGHESILVAAHLAGGTTPKVTLQVLVYDEEKDTFCQVGADIGPLASRETAVVTVHEQKVLLRISAVSGDPTSAEIRVAGALRTRMGD